MRLSSILAGAATAELARASPPRPAHPPPQGHAAHPGPAVGSAVAAPANNLTFDVNVKVNPGQKYQTMIGGGCSGAFGAACTTNTLPAAQEQTVIKMLFSENFGGFSVLRNIIGSSPDSTILPTVPATPAGPFNYTSLAAIKNDTCQLTLAKSARSYNKDLLIYADAWSAPGGFKSTGKEAGGGYICGVRNANCTYDWREAYANYLVQYVKLYQQQNLTVSLLGAYNEPDFNPVFYSAMLTDGYQAYDFLKVLYPIVKKAFPNLKVSCCDSTGARQQRGLLYELNRLGGGNLFDVNTYHNYQDDIKRPFTDLLPNGQPTLETEWSDGGSNWVSTWDVSGNNFEGFQWAIYLHDAFINNVAGWLNWWCSWSAPNAGLVFVNGTDYFVSARLWAMSGYFRFARPGAVRLDATTDVENIYVTAWENKNGTIAVPVINAEHYTFTLHLDVGSADVNRATAYLTNNNNNQTVQPAVTFSGGKLTAEVEPRSMKTFFLDRA